MHEYQSVSIVIPVYNERSTIQSVLDRVKAVSTGGLAKEIILVDDHSTDGTMDVVRNLHDPEVKVFIHDQNQGKGGALHTGFRKATGDIVVIQDADLEYDPRDIEKVLAPFWNQEAEVVYGSRYLEKNPGLEFWHSFFNQLFTKVSNLLTGQRLTDVMTCYKAFSRSSLNAVLDKLESKRFGFEPEITARLSQAGFKICEVPVGYQPRGRGQGKHMNLKGQLDSLRALIKYSLIKK